MIITLYRQWLTLPLGILPEFQHNGIRDETALDSFECIANFYDIRIQYSTDISECDLVVFNLDRYNTYSNLNPVLLVKDNIWETCRNLDIPVVFWNSGECHSVMTEPFYSFACLHIQKPIWYVDSNARQTGKKHLFFDSSNVILALISGVFYVDNTVKKNEYMFSMFTARSDIHKHIIFNHLEKKYKKRVFLSYLTPTDLSKDLRVVKYIERNQITADFSTPLPTKFIPEQTVRDIRDKSCVLITLNSYFINDFRPDYDFFIPLYITEKFLLDLITDKPVIPIGHAGTVEYLRNLGFEFPEWIDYTYDNELNDKKRLDLLLKTIDDVAKITNLEELSDSFKRNTKNSITAKNMSFKQQFLDILNTFLNK